MELVELVLDVEVDALDVEDVLEPSAFWSALSNVSRSLLSFDIGSGSGGGGEGAVADVLLVELTDDVDVVLELDDAEAA